jgi:hypothetical protein
MERVVFFSWVGTYEVFIFNTIHEIILDGIEMSNDLKIRVLYLVFLIEFLSLLYYIFYLLESINT